MSIEYYKNLAHKQNKDNVSLYSLQNIKNDALKVFNNIEIPNRKNEDWKYTNLTNALKEEFLLVQNHTADVKLTLDPNFINLVFIDGKFEKKYSKDSENLDITFSFEKIPKKLENLINKKSSQDKDFSQIMNKAFLEKGYVLTLKSTLEKPILIHQFFKEEKQIQNSTNFILNENGFKNTVIEKYYGTGKALANVSSYQLIEPNSSLEYYVIQDSSYESTFLHQINCSINNDANYNNTYITTGSKTSRTNIYIDLMGPNAECDIHGLYALHKEQHCDTQSYIHHNSPHTYSRQLYKGIMTDSSRGVFTGKVRVEKNSQLINAEQLNKNLILSPKAHANSRPQLEIYADDVKCSHGSTTGQISPDELFYFSARGVKEDRAKLLLAKAFAQDVVMKIQNKFAKSYVTDHLKNKHIEGQNV